MHFFRLYNKASGGFLEERRVFELGKGFNVDLTQQIPSVNQPGNTGLNLSPELQEVFKKLQVNAAKTSQGIETPIDVAANDTDINSGVVQSEVLEPEINFVEKEKDVVNGFKDAHKITSEMIYNIYKVGGEFSVSGVGRKQLVKRKLYHEAQISNTGRIDGYKRAIALGGVTKNKALNRYNQLKKAAYIARERISELKDSQKAAQANIDTLAAARQSLGFLEVSNKWDNFWVKRTQRLSSERLDKAIGHLKDISNEFEDKAENLFEKKLATFSGSIEQTRAGIAKNLEIPFDQDVDKERVSDMINSYILSRNGLYGTGNITLPENYKENVEKMHALLDRLRAKDPIQYKVVMMSFKALGLGDRKKALWKMKVHNSVKLIQQRSLEERNRGQEKLTQQQIQDFWDRFNFDAASTREFQLKFNNSDYSTLNRYNYKVLQKFSDKTGILCESTNITGQKYRVLFKKTEDNKWGIYLYNSSNNKFNKNNIGQYFSSF